MSYPVEVRSFLVVYNRRTGANTLREFPPGQGREAIRARFEAEQNNLSDPDIEVVVLSSHSKEDLLRTHSRYFRSAREIVENARA